MFNTGEVAYLSQRVVFFTFARRRLQLYDLECVRLVVILVDNLVDRAICTFPNTLHHRIVLQI